MTIELQTGLPGHCKTLYTLDRVETLRKQTGRPVFYNGIKIVKEKLPDWQEIKAEEWYTAPPEAIVVIDECQRLFRPRPNGSAVPKYESELETHRHGGIDLVLLTQKPRLISVNVRELVGRHFHAVRKFGLERSTIHEWPELRFDVSKRGDSVKHEYKFNREVFTWYKSAEAHTVKRNIPMKVWVLLGCILLLPVLIGFLVWQMVGMVKGNPLEKLPSSLSPAASAPAAGGPVSNVVGAARSAGGQRVGATSEEYIASYVPRVNGLAYTAPVYDDVTKPVEAPYPAAVIASAARCQAYSQQGTRLDMPESLCRQIAASGFFMPWAVRQAAPASPPAPARTVAESEAAVQPGPGLVSLGGTRPAAPQAQAPRDEVQDPSRPRARARGNG